VPTVEGARVSSNSSDAAPARSTSQSSMLSAPASIAPIDQLGDPSFSHRYSQSSDGPDNGTPP
jgi:hypothetical protein